MYSEPVEFHGIKIRIIMMLPDAGKFNTSTVSYPVHDQITRMFW